jgi:isoquinoline 1-oxidoreductase alpha subunit
VRDAVSKIAGQRVTTIEGLAPDRSHAVQQAWIAEDVPQCGYCQAGRSWPPPALLAKTPKPTDAQNRRRHDGNICRCATYNSIRRAIHRAAGNGMEVRP